MTSSSTNKKIERFMLRAASLQFLSHHYGKSWYELNNEDLDDLRGCDFDEVGYLQRQQHSAPKLSDEDIDD